MQRNYKVYFEDILDAILNIEEYTKNQNFEEFSKNKLVRARKLPDLKDKISRIFRVEE